MGFGPSKRSDSYISFSPNDLLQARAKLRHSVDLRTDASLKWTSSGAPSQAR